MDEKMSKSIRNEESDAANYYCETTEHVELNADSASAETIIRNIRFMAFASGYRMAKDKYSYKPDPQYSDTELIECAECKKVLNGLPLVITCEENPRTLCEECGAKR